MKIRVPVFGIVLGVCAVAAQAQTLTATGPYVAVTDRNAYPKPALPALGPAGSTITDPVFQSAITRVTDGGTRPGFQDYSFRTPSSPHQNEWSAHGSYFYVVSTDGTVVPFRFDAATGTASRINPTASGNGGLTLLTYTEPQFSYVDDSIIYVGYSGTGSNDRTIDQYDFSTGVYTPVVNLDTVVSGLSGTYIGGIASSAGPTERIETFFGGTSQDHHHYVLVFDRGNPSNRVLLDTWASTINGQPAPITLNFSLHHVAIDRSGRYVMLYTTYADQSGTRQAPQSYVWDTQTGSFVAMVPSLHPYGHDALGYGVSVNQDCCTSASWDAAQWQFRSLAAPAATRDMLPTSLAPKEVYLSDHTTWNNASPAALVPYISGTYRYGTSNTTPWRALDDEIFAVETDVPGQNPTIWRFAHHRSDVSYDGNAAAEEFWYEPRPNVSDDGKWVLFTSNWEKTLGTDPKGETGAGARQDVFLVKLRTNDGATSTPSGTSGTGGTSGSGTTTTVPSWTPSLQMSVDAPGDAAVVREPFVFTGWAADLADTASNGVDVVHVYAYPAGGAAPIFLGAAAVGGSRPDVGAIYGSQHAPSAYGVIVRGLAPGAYTVVAFAHSSETGTFLLSRAVSIQIASSAIVYLDTPGNGATVGQGFLVAGWAADFAAASGGGVDVVHVYAYPMISGQPGTPIFLGQATVNGLRPDVGQIFGAQFSSAGYALLAPALPAGAYRIVAYGRSVVAGMFAAAASADVVVR